MRVCVTQNDQTDHLCQRVKEAEDKKSKQKKQNKKKTKFSQTNDLLHELE